MKKLTTILFPVLCMAIISCGDKKKEEKELDATLDKIEAVEQDIDKTTDELNEKAAEVESALNELDNL